MTRRAVAICIVLVAIHSGAARAQDDLVKDYAKTLAKDRDAGERARAAHWLGGRKQPEAVAALAKALSDPDASVRQAAASALWDTGKDAVAAKPELEKALDDPVAAVVARAAGALAVMGVPDKQLAPAWRRALEGSRDDATAFVAARGLIGIDPPEKLAPPILTYLAKNAEEAENPKRTGSNYDDKKSAEAAAKALRELLNENAEPLLPLMDRTMQRSPESCRYILDALAGVRKLPPGTVDLALKYTRSAEPETRVRGDRPGGKGHGGARGGALDPGGHPPARRPRRKRPQRGLLGAEGRQGPVVGGGSRARAPRGERSVDGRAQERRQRARRDRQRREPRPEGGEDLGRVGGEGPARRRDEEQGRRPRARGGRGVQRAVHRHRGDRRDARRRGRVGRGRPGAAARLAVPPQPAGPVPWRRRNHPAADEVARRADRRRREDRHRVDRPGRRGQPGSHPGRRRRGGAGLARAGTGRRRRGFAAPAAEGASKGSEERGLAALRERKLAFDEPSFYRALSEADTEAIRAYLDGGMSVNLVFVDSNRRTPLMIVFFGMEACGTPEKGHEIVALLIKRGADVNQKDEKQNTALMFAADKCDRETLRMLLKAGAKLDAKNWAGLTALQMGIATGNPGLEELIAAGARLDPATAKAYAEAFKKNPKAVALVKKASAP